MTRWLRNKQQRERYGNCSTRTLERMRRDGRLPPARYPFGNKIPANTEAELDAHDAAVILAARPKRAANAAGTKSTVSGPEISQET
jgi:hypothetical protein